MSAISVGIYKVSLFLFFFQAKYSCDRTVGSVTMSQVTLANT